MRSIIFTSCLFVAFGLGAASAQDIDASALEYSLSSHPERFGDDDLEVVSNSGSDRAREGAAAEQADAKVAAQDRSEAERDRGESQTWQDGETKDAQSQQRS